MREAPYREIPLYRRDGSVRAVALVDEEDFERLGHFRWCLDSRGYVYRHRHVDGRDQPVRLHREVLGLAPSDPQVDHINGDPLDNQRGNLRPATRAQQQQNLRGRGRSRHRGVVWHARAKKWMAQAQHERRYNFLGYFDDEDEAGRVAADFRREHMPYAVDR